MQQAKKQHDMKKQQITDIASSNMNAEETGNKQSGEELAKNYEWGDSGVWCRMRNNKWFGTLGSQRITKLHNEQEQLLAELNYPNIETIIAVSIAIQIMTEETK